jgi:hypothetical protein
MFDSKLEFIVFFCEIQLLFFVRIVHGEMKLVIRIKHIDKATANLQKSPPPNGIYMWSYCEHCREVSANCRFI